MESKKSLDHRWSTRQALTLPVKLYNNGDGVVQGHTQNLGIGGMFVETEADKLPLNSSIAVSFTVSNNGNTSHHRLPATVIWSGHEGAGLMFTDFNVETVHTLREILYPEQ